MYCYNSPSTYLRTIFAFPGTIAALAHLQGRDLAAHSPWLNSPSSIESITTRFFASIQQASGIASSAVVDKIDVILNSTERY